MLTGAPPTLWEPAVADRKRTSRGRHGPRCHRRSRSGGRCATGIRHPAGDAGPAGARAQTIDRSEEHTSELQLLMRISYSVFCFNKKTRFYLSSHNITCTHELRIHMVLVY